MKLNLVNVFNYKYNDNRNNSFYIGMYHFKMIPKTYYKKCLVYTPEMMARDCREHKKNAIVSFSGRQKDSIIFKGGYWGNPNNPQKRKLLEDIILLGAILTGDNWAFFSRRHYAYFPVIPKNKLNTISQDTKELSQDLIFLLKGINDKKWQEQFNNGFILIFLFNNSNIFNSEARFLSNIILWELLYSKIFNKESNNLHEIIRDLLNYFWNGQVNQNIFKNGKTGGFSQNIYYVLRNQLAHSGELPINRSYAENWMKKIVYKTEVSSNGTIIGMDRYFRFFDELTQIMVMKTLNFHPENRQLFNTFNFNNHLSNFLSRGRI